MVDTQFPEYSQVHARLPDGETRIFATVGDPIGQARAPAMMTEHFVRMGINAIWLPIAATADRLPSVLSALRYWSNFAGLSVTVPHKALALTLVDRATLRATASGGINLVRREADGSLSGDMVDGAGFVAGLLARGFDPRGKSAVLVGGGGAGSAIAASLFEAGLASLEIRDTDTTRVKALQTRLASYFPQAAFAATGCAVDLAINATPMGLRPEDPLPFEPGDFQPNTLICDIIMKPAMTPLLARAIELKQPIQPGLPMLEQQAGLYLGYFGVVGSTAIDTD